MIFKSERILEPEAMLSIEEVEAYDKLSLKYLEILHNGFIETILNKSPEKGNFLEIGCGTGRISIGLAKYSKDIQITGIDLSENMICVAKKNAHEENVANKTTFILGDGKNLPFEDNSFDSVFCHNMLHHIKDPLPLLMEMKRVVKKDGAFLVRDLVRKQKLIALAHVWIFGMVYNKLMKKEYLDSILASFSKNEFIDMMERLNFEGTIHTYQFITHQGIEKTALEKRSEYFSIPSNFIKKLMRNLYVSKI